MKFNAQIQEIIKNAFDEEDRVSDDFFLGESNTILENIKPLNEFISGMPDVHYFPLDRISEITSLSQSESAILGLYLCSQKQLKLRPVFVYYGYEADDNLKISPKDFTLAHEEPSVLETQDGECINDVKSDRLDFYFVRYVECEVVDSLDF